MISKEKSKTVKIIHTKGQPMLHWIGKKPLDYVKGFPARLVEVFFPARKMSLRSPEYSGEKQSLQKKYKLK